MNDRQRFLQRLCQRLKRKTPRRRAIAARHRRIWCEVLEPRLALAAPVAVNDSFGAVEDTPLTINTVGVIGNDTDADGDALTANLVAQAARGTVSLQGDGRFTYLPPSNFFGPDSFTYRLRDTTSAESNVATVTITVAPVNDPPNAVNDVFSGTEDVQLRVNAPGVLANDFDVDSQVLGATLVTAPRGILTLNPDGGFVYTPLINFSGIDSFTYRASDGTQSSNLATVTIVVAGCNDAPVALNDTYGLNEDSVLTVAASLGVLANDSDSCGHGNPLTAMLAFGPAHGTLQLSANGSFTYTPAANFSGPDSFSYRANNGTLATNLAVVTLTVAPVNDAPVANPNSYAATEDTPLTVAAPGVLNNDTDVDGNPLFAVLVSGPARGTVSLNANGGFVYTPFANYFGLDSFRYCANDGQLDSNTTTVTISVANIPDPPFAHNDIYTIIPGLSLTINSPGVITNDINLDGNALTASLVTGPAQGTLALNPNGSFTYVPANCIGAVSFTYRLSDGLTQSNTATVVIDLTLAPNQPPRAVNDNYTVNEDTPLTVAALGVLANDTSEPCYPALIAQFATGPARGTLTLSTNGSFTYMPQANFFGTDLFTYRANDGQLSSNLAMVTIAVAPINDAPVAQPDFFTVPNNAGAPVTIIAPGVLANDFDVEGDPLSAILTAAPLPAHGPQHGTVVLSANGTFTYTPNAGFAGPDSFTYRANDGSSNSGLGVVTLRVNVTNLPPVVQGDAYSTSEDVPLVVASPGVLANDSDVDGDTLIPQFVTLPANGTLNLINLNGGFTYIPSANFNGVDSFIYRASDGQLASNLATVTINVAPVNDAPVAVNNAYALAEDTPLTVPAANGVLANDTDVDSVTLSAQLVTNPAYGILSLNFNGGFTYTPSANFNGLDSFTYRASDGALSSNLATVSLNVFGCNCIPIAINDAYTVPRNTVLNVAVPGVLANDTDVDGNTLTAILVTAPASGTLTLNANGSFRYTPNNNFTGPVSFTYRSSDGTAQSNVATVTITVTQPPNSPPLSVNDVFSVSSGTSITVNAPGVLANDSDADGDPLTAVVVGQPNVGTLVVNANGGFTYTSMLGFFGPTSFTYRASDGIALGNVATVMLNVCSCPNVSPVTANDSFQVARNQQLSISAPGVLANDVDANGDALLAVLVTSPAHGTLSLSSSGAFTYVPSVNFDGPDAFTYVARDGQSNSNVATVTLQIVGPCLAPTCPGDIGDDQYTLIEDVPLLIGAPGVLANDGDFEDFPVVAVLVTGPARGTLTLHPNGSFLYTPQQNSNGVDSFTYRAYDGQAYSNVARVTLTVTPVNDPPVALPDVFGLSICGVGTIGAPGVLGNDTDVDGNTLTAVLVNGPAHGTLTLNANGSFTYTAAPNFIGLNSFSYRASDGLAISNSATVFLVASAAQNMPPVAFDDNFTVTRNGLLLVAAPGVLANDNDDCGVANLSAQLVTSPAHGTLTLESSGRFQYTPSPGFEGTVSFSYRAIDGHFRSNSAVVSIAVVNENNQPPTAIPDRYTTPRNIELSIGGLGVLGNDLDPEGRPLTAALVAGPANGTLSLQPAGGFTYTPAQNFAGIDSFTYRASDGVSTSAIATVTIAIAPPGANTPPVANHDQFYAIEDYAVSVFPGVLANDTDAERNPLTAALVAGPAHGTLSLSATGSFHYQPQADFYGLDRFTYRASDGSLTSEIATVSIFVFNINDRPVAQNDSYTLAEDTPLNIPALGVLANDSDIDGDTLTASLVAGPAHGTLSLAANGSFTYVHAPGFTAPDSFTYRASDGVLTSSVATVSIRGGSVNVPPSFVKGPDQTAHDESGAQTIVNWVTQISAGPPSEANQTLTFLVTATNSHLFAVPPQITSAGRLTYTPALMTSGTALVTVRLQDSGGGDNTSSPQTFTIAIARLRALHNVRDPLDTNADGFISPIDAVLVINLLSSFGSGPASAAIEMQVPAGLYPDVDGDNFVSPIDAVMVINALNAFNSRAVAAPAAEGESPAAAALPDSPTAAADDDSLASLLTLLAPDVAQSARRRRSR